MNNTSVFNLIIRNWPLLLCVIITGLILMAIFPIYPSHFDISRNILMAKYDADDIFSIFKPSSDINKNIVVWGVDYYRPITRLTYALLYKFWGTNFTALYILLSILFLGLVINIYVIGALFKNRWAAFFSVIYFLSLTDIYHNLTVLSYLNSMLGAFFYTLAMIFFLLAFRKNNVLYSLLGILAALLSCLSKEVGYYLIPTFILGILYFNLKKITLTILRIFIMVAVALSVLFIFSPFITSIINKSCFKVVRGPYRQFFWSNLKFYMETLYKNLGIAGFLIITAGIMQKSKTIFIWASWIAITLFSLLFYPIKTEPYLFDIFIGFSFLAGMGIYGLISFLSDSCKKLSKGQIVKSLLAVLILLIAGLKLYGNVKDYFPSIFSWRKIQYAAQRENIEELIKDTSRNQTVLVSALRGEYYSQMAEIFDRQDLKILELGSNNFVEVCEPENLLLNADFQKGFDDWCVSNRDYIGIYKMISGDRTENILKLEIEKQNSKHNTDIADVTQTILVEPGASYVFGGRLKTDSLKNSEGNISKKGFDCRVRIEAWDSSGINNSFHRGVWVTRDIYGSSNWSLEFSGFSNDARAERIKFICCRALDFYGGRAYFKDMFFRKLKYKYIR